MKLIAWMVVLACLLGAGAAPVAAKAAPQLGLSVRDGVLIKDGQPYRGIGVDYFSAFLRVLNNEKDTSYEQGFQTLAAHRIPFARVSILGFWPNDNKLYLEDKAQFFARLDRVVQSAERNHVGLIPSFFWNAQTVSDMAGEPGDQWGNPQSKTRQFMQTYAREVVLRYRHSPAIWGWEFGNEWDLSADLPNAAEHRPGIVPQLGTPATRTARDEMTGVAIHAAFVAFAREVRQYDPSRIIESGNGFPRPSAWHNRHGRTWEADTPAQYEAMLLDNNPDPFSVISVHLYSPDDPLTLALAIASRAKKPLFAGEFGATTPAAFHALLARIEREHVPLAALWVFDRSDADDPFNVSATNRRAYQLEALTEANDQIKRKDRNNP
ncbi:MAG: hypothetical protein M3Y13_01580 [Armatimonadota bacterium]|nr:hypothetical protein [Armatimonadota bacterium]